VDTKPILNIEMGVDEMPILPVVICLSQRLSHACLSISIYMAQDRGYQPHTWKNSDWDLSLIRDIFIVAFQIISCRQDPRMLQLAMADICQNYGRERL